MAANDSPLNVHVGGKSATKDVDDGPSTIDVVKRDPTNMNQHLKVTFEELIAEPHPTIFSFDSIWTNSYKVFRTTKTWSYRIITLLFAVPAAVMWGLYFALLAFCTVWLCRPCSRAFEIELQCFRGFYQACINTFLRPCYEAVGFCCYNFRIFINKGDPPGAGQSSLA